MSYVCPLNNRSCRCDPTTNDEKNQPCVLARRIGALIRLLGSNFEGEAIGATTGLRRIAQSEGLAFNDLAVLIENCKTKVQLEPKIYSNEDAHEFFNRGVEKGRAEQTRQQQAPPEFYDPNGCPRWNDIALFCQRNDARLHNTWERTFVNDMAGKTLVREPTEKQAKHLLAIFVKLGGYYDPQTMQW